MSATSELLISLNKAINELVSLEDRVTRETWYNSASQKSVLTGIRLSIDTLQKVWDETR